jgi:hypothetical protein
LLCHWLPGSPEVALRIARTSICEGALHAQPAVAGYHQLLAAEGFEPQYRIGKSPSAQGVNEVGESSSQRRRNDGAPKSSMRCNIEQNTSSVSPLQAENKFHRAAIKGFNP